MDLIAGAVQEAGVDEHHPVGGRLDAGLQVEGGAPLLVHDADLDRVLRQPEHVLDPAEQLAGERHLVGSVHLRLDDVDRAGPAVHERAVAVAGLQAVHRDQAGEERVLDALEHLVAVGVHDRVVGHQVTDVADEQQAAPGQRQLTAVRCGVGAVLVEDAGELLVTFGDLFAEVAAVQAQPVAVTEHLVVGVDGGHRVLEILDRGDRGLQHDVLDARGVGGADGGVGIDEDLDVQAVVLQQHGPRGRAELAGVADELLRCAQSGRKPVAQIDQKLTVVNLEAGGFAPRAGCQRRGLIEESTCVCDDLVAADLVIAGALLGPVVLGDHVGAIQRVVQRTPSGVGGVEREPGVQNGHHQLGACRRGDLVVDTRGRDGEVVGLGQQITDVGEELLVSLGVERLDHMLAVVLVDLRLQVVTAGQQVLVLGA